MGGTFEDPQCNCDDIPTTGTVTKCKAADGSLVKLNGYVCDLKTTNSYNCKCDTGTQTCEKRCLSTGLFGPCVCKDKKNDLVDKVVGALPGLTNTNKDTQKDAEKSLTGSSTSSAPICSSLGGTCIDVSTVLTCPSPMTVANPNNPTADCGSFTTSYGGTRARMCCKASSGPTGTQDSDGDGVPDYRDYCPGQKEDKLGEKPDDGCPNGVTPTANPEENKEDNLFNQIGPYIGSLISNALVAIGIYSGTQLLKNLDIMPPEVVDQLSVALTAGYSIGAIVATIAGTTDAAGKLTYLGGTVSGFFGSEIPIVGGLPALGALGLGIGALVWALTAQDEKVIAVYYTCNQWQPPKGGEDCDKCNSDSLGCTSYKCQSLGKSCRLLNQGTAEEKCTWVNPNDIEPPAIVSWSGPLKEGYSYQPTTARLTPTQTGSTGVSVLYNGANADAQNCVRPYSILKFGISLTDGTGKPKLGHCKYDIVRTDKFEDMKYKVDNLWDMYNHTLTMIHGDVNQSIDGINVPNGGNFEVYVRCESTNGYANVGTFVFKYCVSSAPDNEAPQIVLTTPLNGMPVQFGATSQEVLVYVNKPSECKWSHANEDYDTMTETMNCEQTMGSNLLYRCNTTLNGIEDDKVNNFYFNCKSHPDYEGTENEVYRRSMAQSYNYKLGGTRQLVIDWIKPESGTTIKAATSKVNVKLEAHTSSGYKDGTAWCFFKSSTDTYNLNCNLNGLELGLNNPGLFSNTNSLQHSQDLWLTEGEYTYQIKCCDLGGNSDTQETTFIVDTDREFPVVVRLYNENKKLKIITDEVAKCFYSTSDCSYKIEEGIKFITTNGKEHTIEWNTNNNLYIKCEDNFGSQPAPDECTIIARPFSSL